MKQYRRTFVALSVLVGGIAGLRLLATRLPVKLEGAKWNSIEECAENQKFLYQSIEWELRENGKLPGRDFRIKGFPAGDIWKCPACGRGYVLHLENFGSPGTVVIADEQDRHPTTMSWWFRGLHPRVRTMGDGTIELFKGGKVATMAGSRKRGRGA